MKKFCKYALISTVFIPMSANADLFSVTLEQGGNKNTIGFSSAEDLFNKYEDGQLDTILSGYNDSQAATGKVNFRGIELSLDYDASGNLLFNAPGVIDAPIAFNGASQTESFEMFKDYLKENQANLLQDILKAGIANTPYDAIAGNPNSLLAQMSEASFNPIMKNVVFAPSIKRYEVEQNGRTIEGTTLSVPLGAIHEITDDGSSLIWDIPLSYSDVDGSELYSAQVGVTVKFNLHSGKDGDIISEWAIAPGVRVGVAGSVDMISGGVLYSGTLSNLLRFKTSENTTLSMTNMYGRFSDYTLDIDGYDVDYDIQANAFVNGLDFKYQFSPVTSARVFATNTTFNGTDLYIDSYNEAGFAIGWNNENKDAMFEQLTGFVSYGWGDNYEAFKLGVEINF